MVFEGELGVGGSFMISIDLSSGAFGEASDPSSENIGPDMVLPLVIKIGR